jgi:hypothetical protein
MPYDRMTFDTPVSSKEFFLSEKRGNVANLVTAPECGLLVRGLQNARFCYSVEENYPFFEKNAHVRFLCMHLLSHIYSAEKANFRIRETEAERSSLLQDDNTKRKVD